MWSHFGLLTFSVHKIIRHSLKPPYPTSTVRCETAWAWSSQLLSRGLQKCLYCWYLLPRLCSFGTINPNILMSVLDFSDLTQWQVAVGKKQNHFPGDLSFTICKEQLHREIQTLES